MHEEKIMERLVRLETIVGTNDEKRGLVAELAQIRTAIEELKKFQWKLIGGGMALFSLAQILVNKLL